MKKVVVIGGGFTGLTTAYYLVRAGFHVEIHEKSPSWGGLIHTHHNDFGMIETAANGILKTPQLVELCKNIGVSLITTTEKSRKRWIYRNSPQRWPLNWSESLRLFPSLVSLLLNKKKHRPREGETISQWTQKNLSAAALQYLVAPALQGVYAGDPSQMSAQLVLEKFFAAPKARHRKEKRERPCTVAPKGGMGEMIQHLVTWLHQQDASLCLNSTYRFSQPFSQPLSCPHVVATGLKATASLIEPLAPNLSQKFSEVETYSLVSTTIFLSSSNPPNPSNPSSSPGPSPPSPLSPPRSSDSPSPANSFHGFGCLFPTSENFFHLGVLFNDCIFDHRSSSCRSETWMTGGAFNPKSLDCSDQEILQWILKDRQKMYGQKALANPHSGGSYGSQKVLFSKTTRWPDALPSYGFQLECALKESSKANLCGLYFNGNYMGGIGLSRILDRASQLPDQLQGEMSPEKKSPSERNDK